MVFLIKKAKIIDPTSSFHKQETDILIDNGLIKDIRCNIILKDCHIITCHNLHVSAGWFDSSVSFGEPGYEERETLSNGLKNAALSGFTDIILTPNTHPALTTNADITNIINKASNEVTKLHPYGQLTELSTQGQKLTALYDMHRAGAVAFIDYKKPLSQTSLLTAALEYAKTFDALVAICPIDNSIGIGGNFHEGSICTSLGQKPVPEIAETIPLRTIIALASYTKSQIHIPFLSSAKSVPIIEEAKKSGLDITCSISLPHLFFEEENVANLDANFKFIPPLRTTIDKKTLRKALLNKTIDMVTTMHEPMNEELKHLDFDLAADGSVGLEASFGMLNKSFGMEQAIELLTRGRERFGIERVKIEVGAKANLTLFNPEETYKLTATALNSSSKNCCFIGQQLKGKVYGVIRKSKIILNQTT